MMRMSFTSIPVDVLLDVLSYLSVKDILHFRQTSVFMLSLTRLHPVWYNALQSEVLPYNIPVPGLSSRSILSLTSAELESITTRTLQLRKNWLSLTPTPVRRVEIIPLPEEESKDTLRSAVVRFLPGRGNRYLLTVTGHTNFARRRYTVQCWDLDARPAPKCVAIRRFTEIVSVAVNCDPNAEGVLSVTCKVEGNASMHPATFIHALDLSSSSNDPEYAFKYINHFPGCRRLHIFRGSLLVGTNDSEQVRVWNVDTGQVIFELRDPNALQPGVCVNAVFLEETDFLILFRTTSLEIYLLPISASSPPGSEWKSFHPEMDRYEILHPVAIYRWQWRIDSISVSFQYQSRTQYCSQPHPKSARRAHPPTPTPPPMHLFIRFDSWFPWPVNLLHHFVLHPNPSYVPLSLSSPPRTTITDPLTELPYLAAPDQTPNIISSLSSSVRLFAPSDMVLGPWGTALWLDTQTEAWGVSSELGQRIAGRVIRVGDLDERDSSEPDAEANQSAVTVVPSTANLNPPPTLSSSSPRPAPASQPASMIFGIRDKVGAGAGDDEWTHLGMDEEGGRIVVGRSGGRVEIWEYV